MLRYNHRHWPIAGRPDASLGHRQQMKGMVLRGLLLAVLGVMALAAPAQAIAGNPAPLPVPDGPAVLEVRGEIARTNADGAALFDLAMLKGLPAARLETATAVTDGVRRFDGFLMKDLLDLIGAHGSVVTATALNDYSIDIDIDEFFRFDVMVAYEMDGEPLLPSDKGPLWIVYPRSQHAELQDIRYDYRWVWQLHQLEIR